MSEVLEQIIKAFEEKDIDIEIIQDIADIFSDAKHDDPSGDAEFIANVFDNLLDMMSSDEEDDDEFPEEDDDDEEGF